MGPDPQHGDSGQREAPGAAMNTDLTRASAGSGASIPPISANLGFLWAHLAMTDAVAAAARAGFDAVECHWPYATPAADLRAALDAAGLAMLSLNTAPGPAGSFGLMAVPGAERAAQAAFDAALAYAVAARVPMIHMMAGIAAGAAALSTLRRTLVDCAPRAAAAGITLLIEPINRHDVPGYALHHPDQAADIIAAVGAPNLRMLADCYHVGRMGLDVLATLDACLPVIGHVQVAGLPRRDAPDRGPVPVAMVARHLAARGYRGAIGAEYRPDAATDPDLRWLAALRQAG